jgi:hypothetical protein
LGASLLRGESFVFSVANGFDLRVARTRLRETLAVGHFAP